MATNQPPVSAANSLERDSAATLPARVDRQSLRLGPVLNKVEQRMRVWEEKGFSRSLWAKDSALWSREPSPEITDRMGWLTLPEQMQEAAGDLADFAKQIRDDGMRHIVLLGMGGSSLAPEVFERTFGNAPGFPELFVLDSTHPDAVRAAEARIDLAHSLFLVSSKSGTTLEMLSFFRYFWKRMSEKSPTPGRHFVAITDAGSPLEALARERGFRRFFSATPDVGGRYSALSVFGLAPAALMGVDVRCLLDRARTMSAACASSVKTTENPGLVLGAALGELALAGYDKVTLHASPGLESFPSWLEQLIAESTGKDGKGIVPVADEPLGSPESYGKDRVFVRLEWDGSEGDGQDTSFRALEAAGHPSIRIGLAEKADLGGEFFRWEFAIAAAGAALGIQPFNQPDVELAKGLARKAMAKGAHGLGATAPTVSSARPEELERGLREWMGRARPGGYVAIQAYLSPARQTTSHLQDLRCRIRDRSRLATTLGYGPRFLHSTGQLHKGGPNTGLFLQLVDEPVDDFPVPETDFTFGALIHAQAMGDYLALIERGRRVLRVNLGRDVIGGLTRMIKEVTSDK